MKVIFYREKCIGCGVCVQIYPQRWQISRSDGKSNLIGASIKRNVHILTFTEAEEEEFKSCVDNCPVHIIKTD